MRIALLASDLSGAGAQRVLVLLAQAWTERGHDVLILTTHQSPDDFAAPSGTRRVRLDALTDQSRRGRSTR